MSTPIQGFSPRIGAVSAPGSRPAAAQRKGGGEEAVDVDARRATSPCLDARAHDGAVARFSRKSQAPNTRRVAATSRRDGTSDRSDPRSIPPRKRRRELAHAQGLQTMMMLGDDEGEAERQQELVVVAAR